jgi:hypothetical protein
MRESDKVAWDCPFEMLALIFSIKDLQKDSP